MSSSGLPARSALGVRAGMVQQESAFSARHGRRSQLADECGVLVPPEASHCLAMDEFTINFGSPFGSPFGSLTIISSSERQWAQQGSNLRPLACKTSYYGRWTWLDVA